MTIQRREFLRGATGGTVLGLAGCAGQPDTDDTPSATDEDGRDGPGAGDRIGDGELVLATTTSTWDSGLLDALNPPFESRYRLRVKVVPMGTGAALRTARDGDADVVLVHAREAEDAFLRDGIGLNRRAVMYNDFVLVGPEPDPADIHGMARATEAFAAIAESGATFLSRGDDSGTHHRERAIWTAAGVTPGGSWYREVGKGMGDTLVQADQTAAYTLADRGTFVSMRDELELVVHVQGPLEGGPARLENPYGVIPVNPAVHEHVNYEAAMAYVGFLTGPVGQALIGEYTVNGTQLFYPNALSTDPRFQQYVPMEGSR